MENKPHLDIHHIIHLTIIDSFLFYPIIMITKSFASYTIIKPHFDKVRRFSQNPPFSILFNKSIIPCSYISWKHPYISSMLINQSIFVSQGSFVSQNSQSLFSISSFNVNQHKTTVIYITLCYFFHKNTHGWLG